MKSKKLDFFKFINIFLIIVGLIGFTLPFFILNKVETQEGIDQSVPLLSVANYFRFLVGNKNQMFIDIAIHNIAIAIFGFIISFFSRGILGSLALFFNLFVLGTVLFDVHTLPTIVFVLLEFIGICIAIFGGTNLSKRVVKFNDPIKSVFKYSFFIFLFIVIFYFAAAFIESKVILDQWG